MCQTTDALLRDLGASLLLIWGRRLSLCEAVLNDAYIYPYRIPMIDPSDRKTYVLILWRRRPELSGVAR